jgi:hypothetical protein
VTHDLGRSRCPEREFVGDRRLLMRLRIVARQYGPAVAKVLWQMHLYDQLKAFAEREGMTVEQVVRLNEGHLL